MLYNHDERQNVNTDMCNMVIGVVDRCEQGLVRENKILVAGLTIANTCVTGIMCFHDEENGFQNP
jgi:hypothetical protein